jgi:hypothetical protein
MTTIVGSSNTSLIWGTAKAVQNAVAWVTDAPSQILQDVDATNDLLKLAQAIQDITDKFFRIVPLKTFSEGVAAIVEFVHARSIFRRIHVLASGKLAWKDPLSAQVPNLLKISSEISFLVMDVCSLIRWCSSIGLIDRGIKEAAVRITLLADEVNLLGGLGDAACVTGSLLSVADTVRGVVREIMTDKYVRKGHVKVGIVVDHILDVANDVSSIAAIILANVPGIPPLAVLVPVVCESSLSLSRFIKKRYWDRVEKKTRCGQCLRSCQRLEKRVWR